MLHVVHHRDYMAPAPTRGSFRFDKYMLVMVALRESGYLISEYSPEPCPREWLEAVHDPTYVAEVLAAQVPREKERRIGFPVTPHIAQRVRHTNGGTWLAAQLAMRHGYAANSAAGSHHALYDTGAGYCVFNDLAVTANRLIAEGDARRVLILDLDVHQGDGTASLTAGREDIFTLSLHAEKNFPVRKARSNLDVALEDGTGDDGYMEALEGVLPQVLDGFAPDIVLYQAGVDPHRDDRLGRLALSDAGLERRDRFLMGEARRRGVPVASALGGGYGADPRVVAERHARTMLVLARENARFASPAGAGPVPCVNGNATQRVAKVQAMTNCDRRRFLIGSAAGAAAVSAPTRLFAQAASASPRDHKILEIARREVERAGDVLWRRDIAGIADFGVHSAHKRFHFANLENGTVRSFFVTHGSGSDPEHDGWLNDYSNIEGSLMTSRGAYISWEWYKGRFGTSIRLGGLDPTNSNAYPRAIVMHSADYATQEHVDRWGKLGRSNGCFAMGPEDFREALWNLSGGRLLYAESLGIGLEGEQVSIS